MNQRHFIISFFLLLIFFLACTGKDSGPEVVVGAKRIKQYLPQLQEQRVALLVNHTSRVDSTHLVDFLLAENVNVTRIFAPEHGFRGTADAGEEIVDGKDKKTGIPISSLYGKSKKPTAQMLGNVDVVIFDIQDVGARFYTYISSMHYVMEACAEQHKKMMVLDRPNPNGFYVDGPVRATGFESFVGMHPIPVVHGLTVGELALMINAEGWLGSGLRCDLTVVEMQNYNHSTRYSLPVKPSPNLPNDRSVNLYPSICLFEGTKMSVGRGTPFPFQVVGYPDPSFGDFMFSPISIEGMDKNPKYKDQPCYGRDFREEKELNQINLQFVIDFYKKSEMSADFFTPYFNTLIGNDVVKQMIIQGKSATEIRQSWQPELELYKQLRKKYLLYPDFQ